LTGFIRGYPKKGDGHCTNTETVHTETVGVEREKEKKNNQKHKESALICITKEGEKEEENIFLLLLLDASFQLAIHSPCIINMHVPMIVQSLSIGFHN